MEPLSKPDNIHDRLRPKDERMAFAPGAEPSWVRNDIFKPVEGLCFQQVRDCDPTLFVKTVKGHKGDIRAKRFLEMVQDGQPMWYAARRQGTTIKQLLKRDGMREAVKKLMEEGSLPAAVRKQMVRDGLNKIFMQNVEGDLKQQKVALAAAKQIASDPEVGLTAPPTNIGVNIDMRGVMDLMKTTVPIEGLEDLLKDHQKLITDAEYEDIKPEETK